MSISIRGYSQKNVSVAILNIYDLKRFETVIDPG
jgi:hypothetical protein